MPDIRTGFTVHEIVTSVNTFLSPVSAATFSTTVFRDGAEYTGITVSSILSNPNEAVFDFSWSANTVGTYQLHIRNLTTTVIYQSDIYNAKPDNEFDLRVYVGL